MNVFKVKRVAIFALKDEQVLRDREQVKVAHEANPVKLADLGKLLQRVVHVLRHLRSKVDI